jgi:hypothetical protein
MLEDESIVVFAYLLLTELLYHTHSTFLQIFVLNNIFLFLFNSFNELVDVSLLFIDINLIVHMISFNILFLDKLVLLNKIGLELGKKGIIS